MKGVYLSMGTFVYKDFIIDIYVLFEIVLNDEQTYFKKRLGFILRDFKTSINNLK